MGRRARDPLVDLGERQRKTFAGEMAPWKTRSAWDPWQTGMGGEKRVGRRQGEGYGSLYRPTVAETHPVLEAHQSDRKQMQTPDTVPCLMSQTQNISLIYNHDVHRTYIVSFASNSASQQQL